MRTVSIECNRKVAVVTKKPVLGVIHILNGIGCNLLRTHSSAVLGPTASNMVKRQKLGPRLTATKTLAAINLNESLSSLGDIRSVIGVSLGFMLVKIFGSLRYSLFAMFDIGALIGLLILSWVPSISSTMQRRLVFAVTGVTTKPAEYVGIGNVGVTNLAFSHKRNYTIKHFVEVG